jgi:sugar lactone lactonase YvrE
MPELQTLFTGLVMGECPRWHDDRLWFADWGTHEIIAVHPDGKIEGESETMVLMRPTLPISFDWLPEPESSPHAEDSLRDIGRLLIVSGGEGLLQRRERDGTLVTYTDLGALSSYPWNEIVADGRGNVYTNNIGFSFPGGEFKPGIIALVARDGSTRQVADGLAFPNGMVVTPDNSTLIVAESYASRLTAFAIAEDGSLSNRRVWAGLAGGAAPDGICLDADGAIWYADVPNKHCVRVREGGELLQVVELDRGCFACMLGGTGGRMLFMLAAEWGGATRMADGARTGQVLATQAPAPRAGWP